MPTPPTTQIDPIKIFYQNGGNSASQMYVWDGAKPVLWDGSVTFSGTISIGAVSGTLTNNNAAPAANNIGVLPAVVSTVGLGYTSGRQVLLRVDTTGALVVSATLSTTGLATSSNQTDGSQKTQVVNTTNNTQAFNSGAASSTTPRVVLTDSSFFSGSLAATVTAVTTAASRITGYYIDNPNAAMTYVQLFNLTTGAVTLGSTAPSLSFGIPASSAANLAGLRVSFTTALSIAATTTRAGSTAPSSVIDVNIFYE